MSSTRPRHTMLLLMAFVVGALALIALDSRGVLAPLKSSARSVVEPVLDLADRSSAPDPASDAAKIAELEAERDNLIAENASLQSQLADYEQLRDALAVTKSNPGRHYVVANVIGGDPTGLQKLITIDKGGVDGITVGMAVTDPNFFVGLVTSVEDHSAQITLAIDSTASVAAQLLDSQAVGIVYGMWQNGGRMEMRHVERTVAITEGELVVTSNSADARTAMVPPGIVIGKVSGPPETDNQGDSQTIQVLPVVDFDTLTVVTVIVQDDGTGGP